MKELDKSSLSRIWNINTKQVMNLLIQSVLALTKAAWKYIHNEKGSPELWERLSQMPPHEILHIIQILEEKLIKEDRLTVGKVQGEVKVGMPASQVAELLGSPNIVTTDEKRREVWIYDKVSTDRVDTASTSRDSHHQTHTHRHPCSFHEKFLLKYDDSVLNRCLSHLEYTLQGLKSPCEPSLPLP